MSGMAAKEELVHGWVSTHCGRGTSDILWSCLATIILCVWTVIHLPVPCCSRFEEGKPVPGEPSRSWSIWIIRSWRISIIRSGIVPAVISVIAPEFLTVTAITEFVEARLTQKKMTYKNMAQIPWSLTHSFFLHMGGFCLETPSGLRLQLDARDLISAISTGAEGETLSPDWLSEFEKVEEVHINDHAMSNPLTKLIACSQALWLVTQVISRVCQHRAVTLLEVSTLAYAACALTAYAAWWKKPQNSTLPITIPCSDEAIPQRHTEEPLYYSEVSFFEYFWAGQRWNSHAPIGGGFGWLGLLALCPAIFGAIHVASWNVTLPSNVEQWLWRASALYCCTAGMILFLTVFFSEMCERMAWIGEATLDVIEPWMAVVSISIYTIVRLYMIVEVFLSLRALPHSAYESVRWSSFVAHI